MECYLELVGRVLLFTNANKSTRKSTYGTRLSKVAQGLHIAIVLGACGLERTSEHIFLSHSKSILSYGGNPLNISNCAATCFVINKKTMFVVSICISIRTLSIVGGYGL